MRKRDSDPFDIEFFNEDERQEIEDFEASWKPGTKFAADEEARIMAKLKEAVMTSRLRKDSKISFRLPKDDLIGLKAKARRAGIEYQPLLAAIVHKYVMDEIKIEL